MATALPPADIRRLPYYHGDFTRHDQIRDTMTSYLKKDGYFLLRNSIRDPSESTLTVVHDKTLYHMSVTFNDGRCYLRDDKKFKTITDLVKHFKKNDVPNAQDIKHIRLKHPINCSAKPNIESPPAPAPFAQRPPIPVPRPKAGPPPKVDQHYYAYAEDGVAKGPLLLQRLRARDQKDDKCVCGLRMKDSLLPRSWTVHISTENETTGRIFFVSPENQSHWILPQEIVKRLSDKQRKFLNSLESNS